jgi:TonB family protein
METYLIYIAKAAIAAGAFYLAFLLLFQNQKHFTFNRIYLPVSLALSFVIPLITFTTVKYIEPVNFEVNSYAYLAPATGEIVQPVFVFEWYHYLFGFYLLGTAGFLFHLLLGHLKAIKIIQKSRVQKIFNNLVNITPKDVHPFSFFSKIVVSEKTLSHPDLEMIVSHENIHVREKHTLDILFAEIMFLFQWFNPFAWLLKDAVKNNLEYLTDHEIAKHYNPKTYQLAMVTLADKQGIAPFLTALNGSQLKNRIVMMKKKTENKYAFVKQLVVLPLLAVLVMGLSNREVKTEIVQNSVSAKIAAVSVVEKETKVSGKVIDEKGKPLAGVAVLVKGTTKGAITDSKGNFKLLIDDKAETLIFSMNGFESVETDAGHGETQRIELELKADKKAKSGEIAVVGYGIQKTDSTSGGGYSISGGMNGIMQKGSENVTITSSTPNGITIRGTSGLNGQPLYIVDGVETKSVEKLSPEGIEKIEILKDQSSTILYGDKGKNGVILITSKNATEKNSKEKYDTLNVSKITSIIARKGINSGNPLIIVDGQEFKSMEEANVPTEDIANISVLKGETASPKIYGEKAKDGVIIINTKTKYNSDPVEITKTYKSTTKNGEYIFYKVDEMPEFPGGEAALRNFLANSVKYPEIAKENGIQGKVYITFIVTKEGKVTEPEIARGVDPSLDKEALRVVSSLPDWKPGKQHGQPVNVSYTVPITFALQNPLEKQTIFDLRSAIARSIKYPVVAQENNQQGVVEIWAFIAKDGTISRTTDIRPEGKFINIDEVVVTALKSEKAVTSEKSNNLDLLVKESKRVIEQLSPFKVPELLGEMVCFRIKFVLE